MRTAVLLLLFLPVLACLAATPSVRPATAERPTEAKPSLQLIAEARQRGEIDDDAATLYRVYSVVDDSKLPAQYKGTLPLKDGTTVLREARSRYETLRPETQEALKPYLFPRGQR